MSGPGKREKIFAQILATPLPKRNSLLDSACGRDKKLRKEIVQLLLAHQQKSQSQAGSLRAIKSISDPIPDRLKQALCHTYIIEERIGGGGMGGLYLATHKTLGGKFAIKVLAEDLAKNQHVVDRFINEAKIEANLRHPNIVAVSNIGHSGGYHYFVMDYVEGEDLAERIAVQGALSQSEAVSIVWQICKALECAHDHNIIHRDLKPSNIRIDMYGTVILIDFGIARARDVAMNILTSYGERLGTPVYMSPEQIKGEKVDARSDLYSLGVLFYEMLTGENPFQSETIDGVYSRHFNFLPPRVHDIAPNVSPALSEIIGCLLAKNPGDRIQSVPELIKRLQPLYEIMDVRPTAIAESKYKNGIDISEDRMNHIVRRVPATVLARELSSEEKKVMAYMDGSHTIAEILAISKCDQESFWTALESLKRDKAIEILTKHGPQRTPFAHAQIFISKPAYKNAGVWVGASALLVLLIYFAYHLFVPAPASAVQFNATPSAKVTLWDGKTNQVHETPFMVNLAPGTYSAEFIYNDQRRVRNIVVQQGRIEYVHEDFWGKNIDSAIGRILQQFSCGK